jgi:hypothetical protein
MTRKSLLQVLLVVALATVYGVCFTDWFHTKTLKISHTRSRNERFLSRHGLPLANVVFRVNPKACFTELKVMPLAEYETNKSTVAVWHLVSDSNSVPMDDFIYGQHIRGMHPAIKGVGAEALETNVTYRLFITAGSIKGQHDFELTD